MRELTVLLNHGERHHTSLFLILTFTNPIINFLPRSQLPLVSINTWCIRSSLSSSILSQRLETTLHLVKSKLIRKLSIQPYQVLGTCFNPYKAFSHLHTCDCQSHVSNPNDYSTYTSSLTTPFRKAISHPSGVASILALQLVP